MGMHFSYTGLHLSKIIRFIYSIYNGLVIVSISLINDRINIVFTISIVIEKKFSRIPFHISELPLK